MIITRDEADNLLDNENNLLNIINENLEGIIDNGVKINRGESGRVHGRQGKRVGDIPVPPIFREIIAVQANMPGVKQKSLASTWGLTNSQVSAYANGRINQSNQIRRNGHSANDINLNKNLETTLGHIRVRVADRISKTIDYMGDEKLEDLTAKELSHVAANLGRVISSTQPREKQDVNLNVQTVFYSPKTEVLESYDVIEV
jgi:predicted transcriptional regulator